MDSTWEAAWAPAGKQHSLDKPVFEAGSVFQGVFLNSSAHVLARDKVTDYSKGLLLYENDVTLGLRPTPLQAPKQTEMPFSDCSSGFIWVC